jgi:hypothetical protein
MLVKREHATCCNKGAHYCEEFPTCNDLKYCSNKLQRGISNMCDQQFKFSTTVSLVNFNMMGLTFDLFALNFVFEFSSPRSFAPPGMVYNASRGGDR